MLSCLQWEELRSKKPDPNVNHPEDDAAIKEAENTIGDYKLKTDPEYEPNEEELETTMAKYRDLLRVREELFTIRHDYNKEVFALREKKKELIKYIERKKKKLVEIHEELPEGQRKMPPVEVKIDMSREYPENQFTLDGNLDENVAENDDQKRYEEGSTAYVERIQKYVLGLAPCPDGTPYIPLGTEWEKEMREMRLMRKLFKQDKLIEKMLKQVDDFDRELIKLAERRMKIEVDVKYLEIYQLTLYQELWILKDFEKIERKMIGAVEDLTIERNNLQKSIIDAKDCIEQHKQDMEMIRVEQKAIIHQFTSNCSETNFAPFLKRIFKKKYKPCRINNSERDETESSSEYSSEDLDALENAVDNEISKIFLDEQPCPVGCDPTLYELTIKLRNGKIDLEKKYYEENKALNETIKTMENLKMKLAYVQTRLTDKKRELLKLRVRNIVK